MEPRIFTPTPIVNDRGHLLRSGSPVTNLPGASTPQGLRGRGTCNRHKNLETGVMQQLEKVHIPNFGGLSGSKDRGGGDNINQFINIEQ